MHVFLSRLAVHYYLKRVCGTINDGNGVNVEYEHRRHNRRHIDGMDRLHGGERWREVRSTFRLSDPVFKAVGVPALFAAQIDEEVSSSGCVLGGHIPHDAEGITGHLTNLDIAGGGERGVHFCHLPLNRGIKEDVRVESNLGLIPLEENGSICKERFNSITKSYKVDRTTVQKHHTPQTGSN